MLQIPRYILTLHELLAHTPHEHVERNSLDYAKSKLEELSRSEPWSGAGLCGTDGGGGSGSVPSFVSLPSAAPQPVSVELWNSLGACPWSSSPSFRIMHDEVSETENIRKNLAIERMIIEGCEILLDTSQTFVRQGTALLPPCPPGSVRHPVAPAAPAAPRSQLEPGMGALPAGSLIQVPMSEKGKITRGRLGSLSLRKEGERQCFLFSKHLIICTRGSGGKLHLTKVGMGGRAWHSAGAGAAAPHPAGAGFTILLLTPIPALQNGVISLIDCTLIEEQESTDEDGRYPQCPTVPAPFLGVGGLACAKSPHPTSLCTPGLLQAKASGQDIDHLDFKIVVEPKDASSFTVILVASSRQEKAAWTSDISQVRLAPGGRHACCAATKHHQKVLVVCGGSNSGSAVRGCQELRHVDTGCPMGCLRAVPRVGFSPAPCMW